MGDELRVLAPNTGGVALNSGDERGLIDELAGLRERLLRPALAHLPGVEIPEGVEILGHGSLRLLALLRGHGPALLLARSVARAVGVSIIFF